MKLAKAKEIALHRILDEIFVGHNAISVYISLSDHAASLNASHFKDALGSMQRHSLDAFILSLCKIYEKPDNRYPNYSIPTAIVYLQEDMTGLHNGIQNHIKLEQFIQAQIDSNFSVTSATDLERIPRMIVTWFAERCPQTPPREGYELDPVLDALKVLRDKRVAHHEVGEFPHLVQLAHSEPPSNRLRPDVASESSTILEKKRNVGFGGQPFRSIRSVSDARRGENCNTAAFR